jgi:hypothetical protein
VTSAFPEQKLLCIVAAFSIQAAPLLLQSAVLLNESSRVNVAFLYFLWLEFGKDAVSILGPFSGPDLESQQRSCCR